VVATGNQAEIIGIYPRLLSINHNRWLLFRASHGCSNDEQKSGGAEAPPP
jgi:hypothetical protein